MSDTPQGQGQDHILDRLAQRSRVERVEAGMPDDGKLTAAQQQQIRDQVNDWIRQHGITHRRLAARLEISKSTLSTVLSGTGRTDPSRHLLALQRLMQLGDIKDLTGPETHAAVRISTVIDMEAIVSAARQMGTCALIWGPSGAGKTTYARARAAEKSSCVYVSLDADEYTRPRLLRVLAEAMKVPLGGRDADQLQERICASLAGLSRVVFIDNAHLLGKKGFWTLTTIHDRTGATIVCIGQPSLWDAIQTTRSDRAIGATVYGRFGIKLDLTSSIRERRDPTSPNRVYKPKRQWLHTPEDVAQFLASRKIKIHPSAMDWLHRLVNCALSGGFHALEDIVTLASEMYPETPVLGMAELLAVDSLVRPQEEQTAIHAEMQQLRPAVAAG